MKRNIGNDQGTSKQNFDVSGLFPYAVADYGATWGTTASITATLVSMFATPQNGDVALLHNTNGTAGGARIYLYSNDGWLYK